MRWTIWAFSALAAAGGCAPGDFQAALDKAPVQFIGAPGGFGSNVGRTLLALAPPADKPNVAGRLLFAGTDTPSLALADFDGNGKPHVQNANSDEIGTLGLASGQGGISSAAWMSGGTAAGMILLGMPSVATTQGQTPPAGRVAFLNLAAKADGTVEFATARIPQDGPSTDGAPGAQPRGHFGMAVALGLVTQAVAEEAIVVSDNGVHVLGVTTGGVASTTCPGPLQLTPADLHRSLAIGDFLLNGIQEIAIGLPNKGGAGQVVIVQYGPNPANPSVPAELFCPRKFGVPDPVGNPAVGGFGTALVALPDLNQDGQADLLVGAPPDRVYLLFSPFDGSTPPKMFTNGDSGSEFGQRVALVDIDGDGIQEIAITALQADVGSTKKAGQVFVYKLDGDGKTPVAVVNDSNPTANTEFFGIGLAGLDFDSSRACAKGVSAHLLVAGADGGIFTFFGFPGSGPDPRCFAQK